MNLFIYTTPMFWSLLAIGFLMYATGLIKLTMFGYTRSTRGLVINAIVALIGLALMLFAGIYLE